MKNNQKGFIVSILLVIIALLVVGGGVYFHKNKKADISTRPSITVLSPNGGEVLVKGANTQIRWKGGTYPVKVSVVRADGSVAGWIQTKANADDTLEWDNSTISSFIGQSWNITPGQYRIMVSTAANGAQCFASDSPDCVYDISNSNFTISK